LIEAATREDELKENIDRAIEEKIQFKIESSEKRERMGVLIEENTSLREKLLDFEEDA